MQKEEEKYDGGEREAERGREAKPPPVVGGQNSEVRGKHHYIVNGGQKNKLFPNSFPLSFFLSLVYLEERYKIYNIF